MRLILSISVLLLLGMALPSAAPGRRPPGTQLKTLVIDPGHGGLDPGCNGANEIWEKTVTLAISLKVGKLVEDSLKDIKVVYTRKTDQFVELWERANIANKNKADLFLCIHCNSNVNTTAAGSETYFMGLHKTTGNLEVAKRENAAIKYETGYKTNEHYGGFDPNSPESHIIMVNFQTAYIQQSLKFSTLVETHTQKISKIRSRGVKQAGFLVLWQTSMPAVLVETGFLTNVADRNVLKSEDGQRIIARGIFNAIKQYKISLEKSKPADIKQDTPAKGKDSVAGH
ncbi:MAG: N-acetylmuramoyl-L-alanine amidase [Bacteroidetes bacterium]|nr:N-acetylmuramoyl-L-alanine amidase [Bacteroidota bacterium]